MGRPKQSKRGGRRVGAGRPKTANPKRPKGFKLAADVAAYLDDQPNQAIAVEDAIRRLPDFGAWQVQRFVIDKPAAN